MTLNLYLEKYKALLNNELENSFNFYLHKSKNISPVCQETIESVKEFNLRNSKRIRALLIMVGYECFGGRNLKKVIKISGFIELIHGYLLMHDDIIDKDDLRRGKSSMHKHFANSNLQINNKIDSGHYGLSMAILAGDVSNFLGYEMILKSSFTDKLKIQVIEKLNELLFEVFCGEILDVNGQYSKIFNESDIKKIYEYKTARYTFLQPLQIGGILAGANKNQLKKLYKFAIPAGIAFQIKDDIIGLFGDIKITGKPIGSDIKEGKKTLLMSYALKHANQADKKALTELLGKSNIDQAQIKLVQNIVIKTSALIYCQDLIEKNIKVSQAILKNFKFNKNKKEVLNDLLEFIGDRNY
jgi:geranylgeranyl diphosphate synthase, type I